jgi:hypothetical protein
LTLLTTLLVALMAAPPSPAKSAESQRDSLESWVESFASSLTAETKWAIGAAKRVAKDNKSRLDRLKSGIKTRVADLEAALSEQKERFATVGRTAATAFETWSQAAALSWDEMQRSAADALDALVDWMRKPSRTDESSTVRV